MTGQSLAQTLEMPAHHYWAWEKHLIECPPGDFLTQRLLADLILVVERFMCGFAGKNAKPRDLEQVAPWLVTPAVKAVREKKSAGVQASAALQIMQAEDE